MKLSNKSSRILWLDEKMRSKRHTAKSTLLLFILVLFLFIGGCLCYVWSRIQVIQIGYKISNEIARGKELEQKNKKLKLEIAMLKSYSRIEKIAVEELKMIKLNHNQVILIK